MSERLAVVCSFPDWDKLASLIFSPKFSVRILEYSMFAPYIVMFLSAVPVLNEILNVFFNTSELLVLTLSVLFIITVLGLKLSAVQNPASLQPCENAEAWIHNRTSKEKKWIFIVFIYIKNKPYNF